LFRIETTLERNSYNYELRVVECGSGKPLAEQTLLINQLFTRAGTFRKDIFHQQLGLFYKTMFSKEL
jgi:hypothetical protein